jgi:hypothetical protein
MKNHDGVVLYEGIFSNVVMKKGGITAVGDPGYRSVIRYQG